MWSNIPLGPRGLDPFALRLFQLPTPSLESNAASEQWKETLPSPFPFCLDHTLKLRAEIGSHQSVRWKLLLRSTGFFAIFCDQWDRNGTCVRPSTIDSVPNWMKKNFRCTKLRLLNDHRWLSLPPFPFSVWFNIYIVIKPALLGGFKATRIKWINWHHDTNGILMTYLVWSQVEFSMTEVQVGSSP